ncbi:hypothetical protein INT47_004127 [Mucor saturninus]|uniref:Uncharacterized protein n=1 Tax=Mucor saturninus TaxID=64648 RepID=A0A8H7UQH0_9FUNG|nr:hypothetical protein INT47_004127 [Mucor saturninus]
MTTTQDFPIAFAEQKENSSDTKVYREWLENSSEFPVLPSSSSVNEHNLTSGSWELLQRREVHEDEGQHILIPLEEDNEWSKLNTTFEKSTLYSEVMEMNAAELQPKTYSIQSIWINESTPTPATVADDDNDSDYEDDLGAELIDDQKSQSRRANRLSNRRQIHDLKTVDGYVKGIYAIATAKDGAKTSSTVDRQIKTRSAHGRSDKENALVLCAKYSHNMKRRTFKHVGNKRQSSHKDHCEFSVHSDISVKL